MTKRSHNTAYKVQIPLCNEKTLFTSVSPEESFCDNLERRPENWGQADRSES